MRYQLTLAYDGTDFHGWQHQEIPLAPGVSPESVVSTASRWELGPAAPPQGEGPSPSDTPANDAAPRAVVLRTVQHTLTRAVREVLREPGLTLMGASRTDTGVHAGGTFPDGRPGGQVAAFTTRPDPARGVGWPLARGGDALVRALNGRLPDDVLILRARAVPLAFDPIGDAVRKAYTYTIHSGQTRPLWDRRHVYWTWHALDPAAMSRAAAALVGTHDFAGFCRIDHGRETTVRTVHRCEVEDVTAASPAALACGARRVRITVEGGGFLYNMVRIIAGTLVEVGRGRMSEADVARALASADRTLAGPTLPPEGLRLEWIEHAGV